MGSFWRSFGGIVLGIALGLWAAHFFRYTRPELKLVDKPEPALSIGDRMKGALNHLHGDSSVATVSSPVQSDAQKPKLIGVYGGGGALILCYDDGSRRASTGKRLGFGMYRLGTGEIVAPLMPKKRSDGAKPSPPVEGVSGRESGKGVALGEARSAGDDEDSPADSVYKPMNKSGVYKIAKPFPPLNPSGSPTS